jgi:hypothetical protein
VTPSKILRGSKFIRAIIATARNGGKPSLVIPALLPGMGKDGATAAFRAKVTSIQRFELF